MVDDLEKFYTRALLGWAAIVALSVLLVPNVLIPHLESLNPRPESWLVVANLLTSRFAVVVVCFGGEFAIRKWLWRLAKPEHNLSGKWSGTTKYDTVHVGQAPVPSEAKHEVRFEQDCLSLKIAPSDKHFVNWGSLALEFQGKDKLVYAYWVNYDKSDEFPAEAKGFEEMSVTERDRWGRPIKMSGKFYHCAMGQKPVYSGTVKFQRVKK